VVAQPFIDMTVAHRHRSGARTAGVSESPDNISTADIRAGLSRDRSVRAELAALPRPGIKTGPGISETVQAFFTWTATRIARASSARPPQDCSNLHLGPHTAAGCSYTASIERASDTALRGHTARLNLADDGQDVSGKAIGLSLIGAGHRAVEIFGQSWIAELHAAGLGSLQRVLSAL
jgi:hypothetical protein